MLGCCLLRFAFKPSFNVDRPPRDHAPQLQWAGHWGDGVGFTQPIINCGARHPQACSQIVQSKKQRFGFSHVVVLHIKHRGCTPRCGYVRQHAPRFGTKNRPRKVDTSSTYYLGGGCCPVRRASIRAPSGAQLLFLSNRTGVCQRLRALHFSPYLRSL